VLAGLTVASAAAGTARGAQAAAAPALASIARAEDARDFADGTLRRALADPDAAVRARAALAVGRLQDSTTVPFLLPLLEDRDAEVRREAVFALGQIQHPAARLPLERLLGGADVETVDLALEALGKLGSRASTPLVAAYLRDPSPLLRGEAAVALWRIADSTALDPLLERHRDPDPEVRWRVLYALEKIVAPDRVVLIAALHLDDPEWLSRAYAARTMGRQKSPRATAYLIQALADPEPAVVVNAIRALQGIADTTCARCAGGLAVLLGHPHPYVRVTAATALGERFAWVAADSVAARGALDSLARHLADPDAATRGACAAALLRRRGAAAWPRVAPLLSDSSVYARVAVMRALPSLPIAVAAAELLGLAGAGSPLLVRMTAAEVLGELRAPGAVAPLRAGLADTSLLYVASCAGALAALGDSASVASLARAYAARALDADADARISIRDALRDLAGRAFADSVERAHPALDTRPAGGADDLAAPPAVRGAVLHTRAGDIEWAFFGREAPRTVENFARLAERGYFDGLAIHRVVPNFVIQDGDPTGTGSGGPGYTIRCEYNRLRYEPGMVGMALSGKDTGGSQWFITHSPQPHLNGRYTIFARVTRGMDVVGRIVQGDRVLKVDLLR
jgi:cyclophilin family peptidyl-prolyl cis-trans isomerase/HEAT repeat protein